MSKIFFTLDALDSSPKHIVRFVKYMGIKKKGKKEEVLTKENDLSGGLFGVLDPMKGIAEMTSIEEIKSAANSAKSLFEDGIPMYRALVSLHIDDAKYLSLNDYKSWKNYAEREIEIIRKERGILKENFRYVAAIHKKKWHPHFHLLFWDESERVSKKWISPRIKNRIRKSLIKDSFSLELALLKAEKGMIADALRHIALIEGISHSGKQFFTLNRSFALGLKSKKVKDKFDALEESFKEDPRINEMLKKMKAHEIYKVLSPIQRRLLSELKDAALENFPEIAVLKADYIKVSLEEQSYYYTDSFKLEERKEGIARRADAMIEKQLLTVFTELEKSNLSNLKPLDASGLVVSLLGMSHTGGNTGRYLGIIKKRREPFGNLSRDAKNEILKKLKEDGEMEM